MNTPASIFVVDDDESVRNALSLLLETNGHEVTTFVSAEAFLDSCTPASKGCIILDVNMPGMDGPALQEELKRRGFPMPIIFLSGEGSIPLTVHTVKQGAVNFLTKPVDGMELLACVRDALDQYALLRRQGHAHQAITSRLATLSEREREVIALVIAGKTSKEIARHLAISHRTVEIHRAHAMLKTGAANLMELARMVEINESGKLGNNQR